jgi:very-short-patch-repair endonuclease
MSDVKALLDQYVANLQDQVENHYLGIFERMRGRCQSPIEEMMLAALLHANMIHPKFTLFFPFAADYEWPREPPVTPGCALFLQAQMGPYRADFLFVTRDHTGAVEWMVIECDGHDFHERTKQQAQRDRARDRWMQANKIKVFRFTGSEIFRDVDICVDEVLKTLLEIPDGVSG